jgi:tetratricopeptide (TPR) repeat protein
MQAALLYYPLADRPSCQRQPARGMPRGSNGEPRRGSEARLSARTPGRFALHFLLVFSLLFGGAAAARAAQRGAESTGAIRIQPNEQLFATLCALYAAGYPNVPADAPPQLQLMVRQLAESKDPSVAALRNFYRQHKLPTASATLSRYVSFGMVVGPPPQFEFIVPSEGIPPDVRDLKGFQPLLVAFYQEEHIGRLWTEVEPFYRAEADKLRRPVAQIVTLEAGYVRRMNRFEGSRTFTVNVDPLIGSITNFRIYSERYEIAVNPAVPGTLALVRHAFLHFLLDPMVFNEPGAVDRLDYLKYYAQKAPRLPDMYKYDFVQFADECLVRAVEMHLGNLSAPQRNALLDRDDRDGYVLVRPLYNALVQYEHSQVPLLRYFPTLMKSIDIKLEGDREAHINFAPAGGKPVTPKEAEADQITRMLNEASQDIAIKQEKKAIATFQNVLKLDPKNKRAIYGMAVASALSGQGAQAHRLFRQIVDASGHGYTDPSILAWSHVYLGRMNDLAGRRQQAVAQYRAALAVAGLPAEARTAAENGVKAPYTPGLNHSDKTKHP